MQPQESGGLDWWHGIAGIIGAAFGAFSGMIVSVWRLARMEPTIRLDFKAGLEASEQLMAKKIEDAERGVEDKVEGLVTQFHESFSGMRQKINDVELTAERTFVSKSDFDEWKREYREDIRDIKQSIQAIGRK